MAEHNISHCKMPFLIRPAIYLKRSATCCWYNVSSMDIGLSRVYAISLTITLRCKQFLYGKKTDIIDEGGSTIMETLFNTLLLKYYLPNLY